ncbi:hypothetical protein, partial [Pseudomonas nunensis]|uniref:hypothetical protein n=1 Tax=Pseudomonas nunensis TaxID=2961896 RepID=UPI001C43BF5C
DFQNLPSTPDLAFLSRTCKSPENFPNSLYKEALLYRRNPQSLQSSHRKASRPNIHTRCDWIPEREFGLNEVDL